MERSITKLPTEDAEHIGKEGRPVASVFPIRRFRIPHQTQLGDVGGGRRDGVLGNSGAYGEAPMWIHIPATRIVGRPYGRSVFPQSSAIPDERGRRELAMGLREFGWGDYPKYSGLQVGVRKYRGPAAFLCSFR